MSWAIISECITGSSHLRNHKPCQDAVKSLEIEGVGVLCALADGHGSERCPYSQDGAELAVSSALSLVETIIGHHKDQNLYEALRNIKDITLPKTIEREWKQAVQAFHKIQDREKTDSDKALYTLYGTTLIVLLVTQTFVFAVQIGDGDILSVFEEGETSWVITPDVQYGTETYSLCLSESWKHFKSQLIALGEHTAVPKLFLASTDGYANSFVHSSEFLKIGKDYLESIKENQVDYVKKNLRPWLTHTSKCGSGDDISFAIVYDTCLETSAGG